MISPRKKLIEVALPLDAINKEAAREKSIRHGHPSTLHLWWARRPLAACRAVLFASLVDDPGNDLPEKEAEIERKRLFGIIEELVLWENSNDERVLHAARTEIARSAARTAGVSLPAGDLTPAQVREALEKYAPPVLDPFCGGGSIPLEAQRLGLKAIASDLNPVAVLITKALIEIPPKFAGLPPVHPREDKELFASEWKGAAGLAEDVRYYGQWMRDEAEKRIGHLYPKGPNGETVIAWLWARTVKCPNPACEAVIPLVRTFWLSTRKGAEAWLEPIINKAEKTFQFKMHTGRPNSKMAAVVEQGTKTSRGANFACLVCGNLAPPQYLRPAVDESNNFGARLLAVVLHGHRGRVYVSGDAAIQLEILRPEVPTTIEQELANDTRAITVKIYGYRTFDQLFSNRQLTALLTFADLLREVRREIDKQATDDSGYADAVVTYLAFALDKAANYWSTLCGWHYSAEKMMSTLGRNALPMIWDYAEANPFSSSSGNWMGGVEQAVEVLENSLGGVVPGQVDQLDASETLADARSPTISTDPPYYDNVPYSDIADYFYVWLRYSLQTVYPSLFSTLLTPKDREIVAFSYRFDGNQELAEQHFEERLGRAFDLLSEKAGLQHPTTVYYAFKQQESEGEASTVSTGWEKMLAGLASRFVIGGTWPMRTEQGGGLRLVGRNSLASSIVLVCRPRPESAPLATRREFITGLKKELPAALANLTHAGIAPVDLAQASIGPGMSVFSRYPKVLEADGTPMSVRTALQIINQELDEYLTAEEGDLDRETRFALAWFQQFGHVEGAFGEADVLARAKDTAVEGMVRAGILHSRAGKVRLLRRGELEEDWDPRIDARLTVWECTQQLIRRLNETGEAGAARLLKQLGGGRGEDARALAYRLYAICERKKWADEALAYNTLVVSWPEIEKKAAGMEGEVEQGRLL